MNPSAGAVIPWDGFSQLSWGERGKHGIQEILVVPRRLALRENPNIAFDQIARLQASQIKQEHQAFRTGDSVHFSQQF